MAARPLRARRSPSRKSPKAPHRILRAELLESRDLLSVIGYSPLAMGIYPTAAMVKAAANAAPTVAKPITVNNNAAITGKTASLSVLGADDGGEAKLIYNWSVTASPAGGTATFNVNASNAAKTTTATFSKTGTYTLSVRIVDAGGLSVTSSKSAAVTQALTSIRVTTTSGQVVNSGSTLVVQAASQTLVAQGLDQFGTALATQPAFTWTVPTLPSGAPKPTVTTSGTSATVKFGKAGSYGLTVQGKSSTRASVTSNVPISVVQVVAGFKNLSTATLYVSGTSQQLAVPTFVDQFGVVMPSAPALTWSTTSLPVGAAAPTFATSGGVTTATFATAGYYTLNARVTTATSVSFNTTVCVNQTLTRITLSPNTASVLQGATQQFTPQALDQFGRPMVNQQVFTWSTSAGTITASGLFTAPTNVASCTVTAKSGSATGQAAVTVLASSGTLKSTALAALVPSLDADGSISRQDMIQILTRVGTDGLVDATEFSDLKQILNQATTLNIPGYVQALAGDVINGNLANATYQGQPLGNLAAGSSSAQLTKLVNKWFLGTDHPTLCNTSLVYTSTAGSLFPHTPSHTDEYQGQLGDCYFVAALGSLADSNPAAVQNMFIDNGDGTFTVRFYTGTYGTIYNYSDGSISAGFSNNVGTADYVTVDRMLPASTSGILAYAGYGANSANAANSLWIPLAEKAYAQWNETGKEGRDNLNAYASIQGGWMATVDAQVLGYNATDYIMTSTGKQVAINALNAKKAVTIGTLQWSGTNLGLYGSHAYSIIGYSATTDTFTLYNPWGFNQPGSLTWSQLQATTSQMAVADTSGSVSLSGAAIKSAVVKASLSNRVAGTVANRLPSQSAAIFSESGPLQASDPGSRISAAADARRELLASLGSTPATPCHQTSPAAETQHGAAWPSLVDATFAADDPLSESEVLAAFA